MKKIILSTIIASATLMAGVTLSPEKLIEIKNSTKVLQDPILNIENGEDIGSVYYLKLIANGGSGGKRSLEAFVDKKTGDIFLGAGFDINGKKYEFPINKEMIKESVALTYGTGSKILYVVTDPECPYCTKFAKESAGKLSEYTVNVILMPLAMHKNAKPMIDYIISGKDNIEKAHRYKELMNGDLSYKENKYDEKRLTAYVEKSMKASVELNVKGTPSFYIEKEDNIKPIGWVELLNPEENKKVIKEKK